MDLILNGIQLAGKVVKLLGKRQEGAGKGSGGKGSGGKGRGEEGRGGGNNIRMET